MIEEVNASLREVFSIFWESLPPSLIDKLGPLITIFKAIGIAFLLYLIFLIIKSLWIVNVLKRLKKLEKKIAKIDKKLDNVLESNKSQKRKKGK